MPNTSTTSQADRLAVLGGERCWSCASTPSLAPQRRCDTLTHKSTTNSGKAEPFYVRGSEGTLSVTVSPLLSGSQCTSAKAQCPKVPFSMMILLDHVRKRDLPPELKCRQVFPTSGLRSTSLWDTTDIETLQLWLDEYLDADCTNEVFEIQEEFAFGISAELTRLRTAEKVSAAVSERTKTAAAAASQQVTELDAKYRVSEQASSVMKAAREASRAAGSRVATNLGAVQARAMENERVAAAATALNAQWRRLGVHVPGFFNKSPAGSETGEPCARAAAPPKDPARETAGPAGTSPTQAARIVATKREAASEAPQPAAPAAHAAPVASPAKSALQPAQAKHQADGKGSLFTLDDAEC